MSFYRFISLRVCLRTAGVTTIVSAASAVVTLSEEQTKKKPHTEHEHEHAVLDKKHTLMGSDIVEARDIQRQAVTAGVMNNPAVSLGLVLTVFALVGMMRKSYTGDRMGAQQFMQYRIMAQFFTLMALIAGVAYFSVTLQRDEDKRIADLKAAEEHK